MKKLILTLLNSLLKNKFHLLQHSSYIKTDLVLLGHVACPNGPCATPLAGHAMPQLSPRAGAREWERVWTYRDSTAHSRLPILSPTLGKLCFFFPKDSNFI